MIHTLIWAFEDVSTSGCLTQVLAMRIPRFLNVAYLFPVSAKWPD